MPSNALMPYMGPPVRRLHPMAVLAAVLTAILVLGSVALAVDMLDRRIARLEKLQTMSAHPLPSRAEAELAALLEELNTALEGIPAAIRAQVDRRDAARRPM